MREHIQVNVQTGERTVVPYTDAENAAADATDAAAEAHELEFGYIRKRKAEYPSIPDQLDMIYKDITSWQATIKAIKDKYPK